MTTTLEDVLGSICQDVSLTLTNDFQRIYTVGSPIEAKLAHEVLVAFGLDVKVYHQDGKPSKLYVTHPKQSAEHVERIYASALAYAKALKRIQTTLDSLCQDPAASSSPMAYNIAFLNGSSASVSKQIVVQILSADELSQQPLESTSSQEPASPPSSAPAQPQPAAGSVAAVMAASQANHARKYGPKKVEHYEELSSGPAVGRGNYPGKLSAEGEAKANSAKRRVALQLYGNLTLGSFPMIIMATILSVIFSVLVMARAFICPDLAVANKNKAWYCTIGHDEPPPKPQQQNSIPGALPAQR